MVRCPCISRGAGEDSAAGDRAGAGGGDEDVAVGIKCAVPGTRPNLLAHEYFGVDLEIVWNTIQNDLTMLMGAVQKIEKGIK